MAADTLRDAAEGLLAQGDALRAHAGPALAGWNGTAAPLARARLHTGVASIARAADACRSVVPALRVCAAELLRARGDWAEGERLATAGRMALDIASAAPSGGAPGPGGAETARERAEQDLAVGSAIMLSAEDRTAEAEAAAARAFRRATTMLDGYAPSVVAAPDGDLGDGLRKAGEDVIGEITSVLGGALDHVNVFSEQWDDTWAATGRTVATAVTHPLDTGRAMVEGTLAPLGESYRSGGIDEAIGRAPGVLAGVVGGKGLTKLGKAAPQSAPAVPDDPRPGPHSPIAPGGLAHHEHLGGHTLDPNKAHVRATDQQLLDRQARDRVGRVSTYTDRPTAERSINQNLVGNRAAIDDWLKDPNGKNPLGFPWQHPEVVGRSAPRNADLSRITDVSASVVVLKKDANAQGGYYIYTSYPAP